MRGDYDIIIIVSKAHPRHSPQMKDIQDIIRRAKEGQDVVSELMAKSVSVPSWELALKYEYDTRLHPVMNKEKYPDIVLYEERVSETDVDEYGRPKAVKVATGVEKVSRVTYDLMRLAVKRTTELCFGIPIKRIYKPEKDNEKQKEIARYLENIFQRNRINSVNIDRSNKLYSSCEVATIWYAVREDNNYYGFNSKLKLRCATYSPMQGDSIYPLYDETGDLVALSFKYTRKVADKDVSFFDTYTADTHIAWSNTGELGWSLSGQVEPIAIGKIPAVYRYRRQPAWEDRAPIVYEMEWAVSRNGNYLRTNSRPILMAAVNEEVGYGNEPKADAAFRDIVQYPQGSTLQYVTWNQAIDNLKFYVEELKQSFFTQLQLPDWSYENMKTSPMSGEARKQLFIDCHLKVKDEAGDWIEFFDREVNVVKAFLKQMLPQDWHNDIDALVVENQMTPYIIDDRKEDAEILLLKNGQKPLMSQRESIQALGESEDVDATLAEIQQESAASLVSDALGLAQ